MSKRYDVCAPRKKRDGGTFWKNIGTAWENDKGIQIVFDALPLPDNEGRCVVNLFEPRKREPDGSRGHAQQEPAYEDDSDIPFLTSAGIF